MARTISSAVFGLVLLCLALPWLSFRVGCTGNLAPQRGGALLIGHDAHIDATSQQPGPDGQDVRLRTTGTIELPPQPFVWSAVGLAVVGIALFWARDRRAFLVRVAAAVAGVVAMLGNRPCCTPM
ncbi:MAG: hypothetical protein ACRDG3_10600 [Tepidiformaceae bacterium]